MSVITYLVFNGASAVVDIVTISQYIHNIVVPHQGNVMFLFGLFDKILIQFNSTLFCYYMYKYALL